MKSALLGCFAAIGVVATLALTTGVVLDFRSFDRTSGGHEPPYTGYTGAPIDWAATDRTAHGMARRGHVTTFLIDCTSGMVHIEFFGQRIPFRKVSERAIVVHKPREACRERGFQPRF